MFLLETFIEYIIFVWRKLILRTDVKVYLMYTASPELGGGKNTLNVIMPVT